MATGTTWRTSASATGTTHASAWPARATASPVGSACPRIPLSGLASAPRPGIATPSISRTCFGTVRRGCSGTMAVAAGAGRTAAPSLPAQNFASAAGPGPDENTTHYPDGEATEHLREQEPGSAPTQ